MFYNTKIIEKLKIEGANIDFIDGMSVKIVSDLIAQNITDVRVSPLSDNSVIYVLGTDFKLPVDDKNRIIRVDTPVEIIQLICDKILNEKWNMFTEVDEEKRIGYTYTSRGEVHENKVMKYTLNIAYNVSPFMRWTITLEKGSKQITYNNGQKFEVKNSYQKISSINMNLSTNKISLLAIKLNNTIKEMRNYAYPIYYQNRQNAEKILKNTTNK